MFEIVVRRKNSVWHVEAGQGDQRQYQARSEALHRVVECLDEAHERGEPASVRFVR